VYDKGPLPSDPAEDVNLPPELQELKSAAVKLWSEYQSTGVGIPTSMLYDGSVFYSTDPSNTATHDAQIAVICSGFNRDTWESLFQLDTTKYFEASDTTTLAATAENVLLSAGLVQPRSEGRVTIVSKDPADAPQIDYESLTNAEDVIALKKIMRHAHEIASQMGLGSLHIPVNLANKYAADRSTLSDALLEEWIQHYCLSYYHPTCTCRIGKVVDPKLRVLGISGLRVADASVMPNTTSGNTMAPCIMIGEKAAVLLSEDHGTQLSRQTTHCPCCIG